MVRLRVPTSAFRTWMLTVDRKPAQGSRLIRSQCVQGSAPTVDRTLPPVFTFGIPKRCPVCEAQAPGDDVFGERQDANSFENLRDHAGSFATQTQELFFRTIPSFMHLFTRYPNTGSNSCSHATACHTGVICATGSFRMVPSCFLDQFNGCPIAVHRKMRRGPKLCRHAPVDERNPKRPCLCDSHTGHHGMVGHGALQTSHRRLVLLLTKTVSSTCH